jgi:hypothetical protein
MPQSERHRIMGAIAVAAIAAAVLPGGASAGELWREFPRVDSASGETCQIDVHGPRHYVVLNVTGLDPYETGELVVLNGSQEFAWRIGADRYGTWQTVYLPYLRDSSSGIVLLNVQTPSCFLSVNFPWEKSVSSRGD